MKTKIIKTLQRLFSKLPDKIGIKFLLRLLDKIYFFTLGVIKLDTGYKAGIHPKHIITDFHDFYVSNVDSNDVVLDIGCAYGTISKKLSSKVKSILSIDIREDAIILAKKNNSNPKIDYKNIDFFELDEDLKFDVIILSNVLEHIEHRHEFLVKCLIHAPKLLIRVPAFERDWLIPYKKSLGLEWRLHSDHFIEHKDSQLRDEIISAGWEISHLSCKWGNYNCIAEYRV